MFSPASFNFLYGGGDGCYRVFPPHSLKNKVTHGYFETNHQLLMMALDVLPTSQTQLLAKSAKQRLFFTPKTYLIAAL